MEIKTAYSINDLVQHKYQRDQNEKQVVCAFEVIEIQTVTCSAGTQNFYSCRGFVKTIKTDFAKDMEGISKKVIDIGFADRAETTYYKFRADELKPCAHELKDVIMNKPEKN